MKYGPEDLANWLTIQEIADLVADDYNNIVQFIIDNKVPHGYYPDGILIPLRLFQMCMPDLYNLAEELRQLDDRIEASQHDEQDVLGLLTKYDRENRDV